MLNLFNEKGFLSGTPKDAKEGIRQEVVEEHAIEAGAEEVSIQGDSVEVSNYNFFFYYFGIQFTEVLESNRISKLIEEK